MILSERLQFVDPQNTILNITIGKLIFGNREKLKERVGFCGISLGLISSVPLVIVCLISSYTSVKPRERVLEKGATNLPSFHNAKNG